MILRILLLFLFGLASRQVLAEKVSEAIIGGEYAHSGQFKYQVAILSSTRYCGGAIIADQYILTANHCVTQGGKHIVIQPYTVIAGIHNLAEEAHAIIVPVEIVYIHKQFDPSINHHDIAILKLQHALNLSHHHNVIQKIDLPKSNENLDGKDGIITGFGLQNMKVEKNKAGEWVELGGTSDGKLKFAHVKILSQQHCIDVYSRDAIRQSIFCAQVHQRHKHPYEGVCGGDSGSPLVHGHEVVGILSSSPFACNETTRPAKYTSVGSYLNLINNVINGKPDNDVASAKVPE